MRTELATSIAQLHNRLSELRRSRTPIGLVPTMGGLHAGHARLIEKARRECQCVVVSIFVNPLQFDREGDLRRYPRTLQTDLDVCTELGVDVVFAPSALEIYPTTPCCVVEVIRIADHLCGRYRPGHFRGVATVILKLLQIAQPERAYFGEKDAQQLRVVRRLVEDFNLPVSIVGVPTVREPDGLALSSRNRQLGAADRGSATALYRALREAEHQISRGVRDVEVIKREAAAHVFQEVTLRLEYLQVVDPDDLQPVERVTGPVLVAGAIWIGSTRLIDNLLCGPPAEAV